jgi:hypothetical protein
MFRDDAEFLETVAHALGERVSLIRQRGFSLVGSDGEHAPDGDYADVDESDLIDLAASGWLDWDARNDDRPYRRNTAGRRRKRLKIA